MKASISQIRAIIHYEILMGRRGIMGLVFVVLVGGVLLGGILARLTASDLIVEAGVLAGGSIPPDQISTLIVSFVFPVAFILAMGLPLYSAMIIPNDNQIGMREVLKSLPMSATVYLGGKLLSVWVLGMGEVIVSLLIGGVAFRLLLGEFSLTPVLGSLALLGMLLVYSTGMTTLLAAGQPTKRRAVMVAVAFVTVQSILLSLTATGGISDAILARQFMLFMYVMVQSTDATIRVYPDSYLVIAIVSMLVQLTVAWTVVWLWTRWRMAR